MRDIGYIKVPMVAKPGAGQMIGYMIIMGILLAGSHSNNMI
ncbi:hypothetical protein MGWOODY_Mmi2480 [hydrothermal vent metagenome]|uniref:Uncharacterized protein n=1 Tax=hydrothermal vent metagenome TaxID=652676 RepID=A0A160VJF2_9ZZZZ